MSKKINPYNDEFVRFQLYTLYAPPGITYEQYSDELDVIVEKLNSQNIEHDAFLKEYSEKHKCCPKCGSERYMTTLAGYILDYDKKEEYKDLNTCTCIKCGDTHSKHARINNKIK